MLSSSKWRKGGAQPSDADQFWRRGWLRFCGFPFALSSFLIFLVILDDDGDEARQHRASHAQQPVVVAEKVRGWKWTEQMEKSDAEILLKEYI